MNIKEKRLINKVGNLVVNNKGENLCYLDLNKLEKSKKLTTISKKTTIYLPESYANIKNITYIISNRFFNEELDIIAYNTPDKNPFNIRFEECYFKDNISVLANNIKMINNLYLDKSFNKDLKNNTLKIQGDNIILQNETRNNDSWNFHVSSYENIENSVNFIDSTLKFKNISLWTDEIMYLNKNKNLKIKLFNSSIDADKRSLLKADFSQMIIKNSTLSENMDIKLRNTNNMDPDSFSLILNNSKINSIHADIEADTILLAINSYIHSPDIKIRANYTTLSTGSKISGFNMIIDSTYCVTEKNCGNIKNIEADNSIYIKTKTPIDYLNLFAPTIIYNDKQVQPPKNTNTSSYNYVTSNSNLEEKNKIKLKRFEVAKKEGK